MTEFTAYCVQTVLHKTRRTSNWGELYFIFTNQNQILPKTVYIPFRPHITKLHQAPLRNLVT